MFTENLDGFLSDFGLEVVVEVSGQTYTYIGILDMPDATLGGLGQSTEYLLTMKTSDFALLDEGQMVEIDGVQYALRGPSSKFDDGKFSRVELTKL
jgi:hypothetical protein